MKFLLKFIKDCALPCVYCEECDTEITDAELATVYWRSDDYNKDLHVPLLVHKSCMSAAKAKEQKYDCSMEFQTYLVFLLQNIDLHGKKLADAFRVTDLISLLK